MEPVTHAVELAEHEECGTPGCTTKLEVRCTCKWAQGAGDRQHAATLATEHLLDPTGMTAAERIRRDLEPLDLDGRFIWGVDLNSDFSIDQTYGSRAEAVAAGRLGGRWSFQTARLEGRRAVPESPLTAEAAIDLACDSARDEWLDSSVENFAERAGMQADKLYEALKMVWNMWCTTFGIEISGYLALDIESHEVKP